MLNSISTKNAPGAIGPYSQAVKMGDFLFVSGQLPVHPVTNVMPETIAEQTKQSLENVKAILEAAGSDLQRVVKTTVFLDDMNAFTQVNEVYQSYFSGNYPARSAVEVARLPKDASVEIEVIACVSNK
ncbi:RidA family protein [Paenibacillus sp. BSR1-1]|uniref:RidA family protein n=1 Tax=Paenibacillus sp. BSR1-1 TaxID=3020845 RepID=UPI0025B06AE7|nr:RidA family protein [Paenibacillus sp. BSR1-1]MDN3017089.1 RidA family protein [Paenibacillus sp. BSR1-1]